MFTTKNMMVVLVVSLLLVASSAQANLFTSGDMDSGGDATTPPDGWSAYFVNGSAGTVGVSSDTPDGSAQSIELTGGETSGYDYWTQAFAYSAEGVYEGDYTLSYDWKGDVYTSLYDQNWGKLHAIWERSTEWTHWEGTITVPAGTEKLRMGLYDNSGGPGNTLNSALFDNLSLTFIPEPSTMILFGIGGFILLIRRRK